MNDLSLVLFTAGVVMMVIGAILRWIDAPSEREQNQ